MSQVDKRYLNNQYVKATETTYVVMQVSFDNTLNRVELLHLDMKTSREIIGVEQEIVDTKLVPIGGYPDS